MKVLIIDDEPGIRRVLSSIAERAGHAAMCVDTIAAGLDAALRVAVDIVFLDVHLPDGNGLDLLPQLRGLPNGPDVIILTGFGDPDGAEMAIRNGAWDYIEKCASPNQMLLPLMRAMEYRKQKLAAGRTALFNRETIIGHSAAIRACLETLATAAGSDASVLITGETGTGKELFARSLHDNSDRRDGPYVIVDCAALPETLVESTLFGHVRGAFTGADSAREGLLAHANGGTVLLDEVGELPLTVQKTFLRVLQEKRFLPVGGTREVRSDFRLFASTNRNLEAMVQEGLFRQDLLFRLRAFTLTLPPLRERSEDIFELAMFHLFRLGERYGFGTKGVAPEFVEALQEYGWPGNVRELFQAMERTLAAARYEPILHPQHLPGHLRVQLARRRSSIEENRSAAEAQNRTVLPAVSVGDAEPFPKLRDLRETAVARFEKQYMNDLMAHVHGDAKKACAIAGVSKSRFYELLKKYGIS